MEVQTTFDATTAMTLKIANTNGNTNFIVGDTARLFVDLEAGGTIDYGSEFK